MRCSGKHTLTDPTCTANVKIFELKDDCCFHVDVVSVYIRRRFGTPDGAPRSGALVGTIVRSNRKCISRWHAKYAVQSCVCKSAVSWAMCTEGCSARPYLPPNAKITPFAYGHGELCCRRDSSTATQDCEQNSMYGHRVSVLVLKTVRACTSKDQ